MQKKGHEDADMVLKNTSPISSECNTSVEKETTNAWMAASLAVSLGLKTQCESKKFVVEGYINRKKIL